MDHIVFIKYALSFGILLTFTVVYFYSRCLLKIRKNRKNNILIHIIQAVSLSFLVISIGLAAETSLTHFNINLINKQTIILITSIIIALIFIIKMFLLLNLLEKKQVNKGGDPTSARIITRVFKISIVLSIILLFGEHLGMSLSGLLAFGGIGGIALAMASKDILSNLFSGIMLYFDRPFNIGDWISSPDREIEGTVVEIGWRLTKITTFDHRPLYIPNSIFSTISVENPGRMSNRRIKTEIGLRYEDAEKIENIVKDIREMLEKNPNIDTSQTLLVYFNDFADSSLNIMVYCFTKTTNWAEWLSIQQNVYLQIIQIVKHNQADFAFPSQTVYIDKNTSI